MNKKRQEKQPEVEPQDGINYPEKIIFWDEGKAKIKLVNASDFHREDLLNSLGLKKHVLANSFGSASYEEVIRRQEIAKFCLADPDFRSLIARYGSSFADLPAASSKHDSASGQEFVHYFFNEEPEHANPFFRDLEKFVGFFENKEIPTELKSFVGFLKGNAKIAEFREMETMKKIFAELKKMTYLEGAICFEWNSSCNLSTLVKKTRGYKKYSLWEKWGSVKLKQLPSWMERGPMTVIPLRWIAKGYQAYLEHKNDLLKESFSQTILITEMPNVVEECLKEYVEEKLNPRDSFPRELSNFGKIKLDFFYKYSEKGLSLRFAGVDWAKGYYGTENEIKSIRKKWSEELDNKFPGYSRRELRKISKANQEVVDTLNEVELDYYRDLVFNICLRAFHRTESIIYSEKVDELFKWQKVQELYENPAFAPQIELIKKFRSFVSERISKLNSISWLVDVLEKKSQKFGWPLTFPAILTDEKHLINFKSLVPISLADNVSDPRVDLVKITGLPSMNGQIFCFTGQNAGGKSVAQQDICNAIYLAQSGLPIFAEEFTLNVKKTLGVVFIERNIGSTAELLLTKTKNILTELKNNKENGIFLVIDDLGSAAGEIDGFPFGKNVLQLIREAHVSAIVSTQITALAEFAEKELGAKTFQFDLQHNIKPGIGKGNLSGLMKKVGLDEFFTMENRN